MKSLIPTKKQFLGWTMLSRIGYIAAVIGISVGAIQLTLWGFDVYQWSKPTPKVLSNSDKLLIDQNPTKLEIKNVRIEKYDSKRDIVIFELLNSSTVTAKNVRVDFYNHRNEKSNYSGGMRYIDSGDGINIPAGESRSYRVAYKKDYETFFNPNNPGEKLLKVSKEINSKNPFELQAMVCGDATSCSFNSTGNSTIVSIRYGSIFGHKYTVLTQFYNTFLDGDVNNS